MKKVTILLLFSITALGLSAQTPISTQSGIVPVHNLRVEDTTYMGQLIGIWAIDAGDTMFGFVPVYVLPDSTLIVGSDTVYTSGNFTPSPDTINLATNVYGVLPVLNGGTGHDTLTANKVLVGNGTSPILSPAALHWDNGNGRLGIGTSTPNEQLELTGNLRLPSTTTTNGIIYFGTSRFVHGRSSNTFVGGVAGNMTLTGSVNTAVGNSAMPAITSGLFNSGLGGSVLLSLTTGSRNAALGHQAARNLTAGEYNTAVGASAMLNITTTSFNTAIGYDAGRVLANGISSNTTGSRSVFIGASTKANADAERNQIVIGYNATGLGANTVIIGNDSIITTALRGNVGIGTTTPARRLHIAGEVRITDLVTDTATVIVGADADGDLDRIVVGSGLSLANDTLKATGGSSGTVTSVGLTMPAGFAVSGSPVTTSGTLAVTTALNGPLRGDGTGFTTGNTNLASEVTGTLPVANGGTGATTLTANKVLVGNGTSAILSPANLHWDNGNSRLGIGTASPTDALDVNGTARVRSFTGTPTRLIGANGTGLLDTVIIGTGLTLSGGTLSASGGGGGSGTVTSVGLSAFTGLTVTGSPVTTSGTLALANGLAANKVMVSNGTTGYLAPAALHWDNTNSRLGVNTSAPASRLSVSDGNTPAAGLITTDDYLQSAQNYATSMSLLVASSSTAVHRGVIKGTRSRGTLNSPSVPTSGDDVLSVLGAIYDGVDPEGTAEILFEVDGNVNTNIAPQRILFQTSASNGGSRTHRMTISSNGNVGIATLTPAYAIDINSTGGLRLPRGTVVQRPMTAAGVVRFSTTANTLEWSDGTNWESGVSGEGQGPASGFNRVALWTGAQEQTSDEDLSFNISTGQMKLLKYSSATAFAGTSVAQLHVTSTGEVITKTSRDTQYVHLVAVEPGTAITQTANTDFYHGSYVLPNNLSGYTLSRADYAITNSTATTGALTVRLQYYNATNVSQGTAAAVTFNGTSVRESTTNGISNIPSGWWLHAETGATNGTLNNTVQGLLITLMFTK